MFYRKSSFLIFITAFIGCQSIPHAEMVVVPGPNGTFTAEATSVTKVEALKGAKYIAQKECDGMKKRVAAGKTTIQDLRQKRPTEGLAGAAAAIFQKPGRDHDSFSASMAFSCK
jgi:hypothetical protein